MPLSGIRHFQRFPQGDRLLPIALQIFGFLPTRLKRSLLVSTVNCHSVVPPRFPGDEMPKLTKRVIDAANGNSLGEIFFVGCRSERVWRPYQAFGCEILRPEISDRNQNPPVHDFEGWQPLHGRGSAANLGGPAAWHPRGSRPDAGESREAGSAHGCRTGRRSEERRVGK